MLPHLNDSWRAEELKWRTTELAAPLASHSLQKQEPFRMAESPLFPPAQNTMNKDHSSLFTQECQIWNHNQASISSAQHAPHANLRLLEKKKKILLE